MSDYKDPVQMPEGWQPPVRHRRSERRRAEAENETSVSQNAEQPEEQHSEDEDIQWSRRAPEIPGDRGTNGHAGWGFDPEEDVIRPSMRRNDEEDGEDDDEEEYDGPARFPWLKALLILLALALVLCVALLFLKDAGPLNPIKNGLSKLLNIQAKAPAEVNSFQAASSEGVVNARVIFNLATNQSVEGVKIVDEDGNEIAGTSTMINGEEETNRIWSVQAVFDEPYTGNVYAMVLEDGQWKRMDKSVALTVMEPTPAPTASPAPTAAPTEVPTAEPTAEPAAEPAAAPTDQPTWAPTAAPTDKPTDQSAEKPIAESGTEPAEAPTAAPVIVPTWAPTNPPAPTETPVPTEAPTALPTLEPTEAPTLAPTAEPTQVPTASPVPRLEAQQGGLQVTESAYQGSKALSFQREEGYVAPNPEDYSHYEAGVLTFRGDNFRRNAAFGTVNVEKGSLSILWQSDIGSLRTADNGTLYGVGWTGQPAIVKWTSEVRRMMNLYDEKKETLALREVIFAAQDGKIYFLDLRDGTPTRDPITVGYPMKGSVSVDTYGRPLLAVGQGISKLPNKTGDIGLRVFNLIDGKEAYLLNGRKSSSQVQYVTNGAFDGTALFLYNDDAMVVAGENGLLYTVDLNSKFVYPNAENPDAEGSMAIKPDVTYLRTKADIEGASQVGVESSVAMYDKYIYMADTYGVVRCVNSDTMTTVWAVDCGDNTDAAVALDMNGDDVSLYTGNTAFSRLGSKQDVTIRRLNALTGEEIWQYTIKTQYADDQTAGCKASPVIGQHNVSDLVYFTVNRVGVGSRLVALDKTTGQEVWGYNMNAESVSSPVAVYNDNGDAWIIQGNSAGDLVMLDARTGDLRTTVNLGGAIQGSPAAYKNYLVVGTSSKDNAKMYGILIE